MINTYWQNKRIAITGGSSGLGLAIAKEFANQGASIRLIARDESRLKESVQQFGEHAEQVDYICCDVTDNSDVERLFERLNSPDDPPLDAFVNAAGMSSRGKILDTTPEDFQQFLELNFLAAVRCTRLAVPMLLESNGHLVNIGSLASKSASRFLGPYPATKSALATYTHQLRLELGDQGLHTLLVCPGPISRSDAGNRYNQQAANLPESARKPGGGVKVKSISPEALAKQILVACEKRAPELVIPSKAKLLFAISQLSPRLGDWIIRKKSS